MTPLDFVDNMGPSWSANVMAFVGIRSGPRQRPLPRFTLFTDGIHLFGWNVAFPSRAELLAWRIASLVMFCSAAMYGGAEIFAGLHRDQIGELLRVGIFQPSRLNEVKEARPHRPLRP